MAADGQDARRQRRGWSLQARIHAIAGCVFLLGGVLIVLLVNRHQRAETLRISRTHALAILERNDATHRFLAEDLRPALHAVTAGTLAEGFFDPNLMSSVYAQRRIAARVPSAYGVFVYREGAIDARNPAAEADAIEREFLARARQDPSFQEWSGTRELAGEPWFVLVRPGQRVQPACLECHSTPARAPADLVARYGAVRGFGRTPGVVGSVQSVRLPLAEAYAEANAFSLRLSALLLGGVLLLYLGQWAVQRRLLYAPLRRLQRGALLLAADSRTVPLPVPPARELRDVTVAFNAMAASIARQTQELEGQVELRTRQLLENEAALRQTQKMDAVGRLAGGVAHDFNNLLTAIRGYADLIAEALPPGDARADLDEIRAAASRAANLTRQLLAFSRRDLVQVRAVSPDAVVAQLARMLERLIPENVKLRLELGAPDAVVRGDAGQLEQVVLNLVLNARDAMPSGGAVRIVTERVAAGDARAAADGVGGGGGGWCRVSVVDEGVGMDDAVLSHLFEPFFTTKARDRGTGLGLATAYGIVRQHGGHIAVESRPGAGSTFRVYLPECPGAQVERAAPPRPSPAAGSETVLVAEDEPAVRRLVLSALRRRGYRVLESESAEDALRVARAEPRIDLLLTDLVMTGQGGHELAAQLRGARPGLRVVFMSGYAPDELVRNEIRATGAAFVQKPFTPDELAERVRAALDAAA